MENNGGVLRGRLKNWDRGLGFNPVGFPFSHSDSPWYRSGLTPMEVNGLPDLANHNFSVIQSM